MLRSTIPLPGLITIPTETSALRSAALVALLAQGIVDYTLRNAVIFFVVMSVIGCLLAAIRLGPESDALDANAAILDFFAAHVR